MIDAGVETLGNVSAAEFARTHLCGCGGRLVTTLVRHDGGTIFSIMCVKDKDHTEYQQPRRTRIMWGPSGKKVEVDILTGRELEPYHGEVVTQETMLAKIQQAERSGMFPETMDASQRAQLARAARAYGLDPIFGEIMPYQGKPYITIDGRRRKDREAGYSPNITHRVLNADEREAMREEGTLEEGDVIRKTMLADPTYGSAEREGRVGARERKGNANLPIVKWPVLMAEKRGEYQARRSVYGPIPIPPGLEPGDAAIEGELTADSEALPSPSEPGQRSKTASRQPTGKLGSCTAHGVAWHPVTGGRIGHPQDGGWCWKDEAQAQDPAPPTTGGSPQDDMAGFIADLDDRGWTLDVLEQKVLKMSWEEWVRLGGTIESALKKLEEVNTDSE